MTTSDQPILEFLDFVLEPAALELRKAGALVVVEPQVFELIAYLAGHAGRVVGRDELVGAVWHGRVVSDSTISSRVNSARRALDDDGRTQAVIKTVHGRGFRFDAAVVTSQPPTARAGTDQRSAAALALPDRPSVAVLPLVALRHDERHEFLADGITEDVISGLARISAFFVIGRNSSFSYKGRRQDSRTVGRELGVRYLVVGSVRMAAERIRVSAQLVDAVDGHQLWSDTIDREVVDPLLAQEDVARTVVSSVHTQILLHEGDVSEHKLETRQQVSDLLNRAWQATAEWTREGLQSAHGLAVQALVREPDNARAHVIKALANYGRDYLGYTRRPGAGLDDGIAAAREAVRLAPNNEYAHWVMACCSFCCGAHDAAIAHAGRAIEISPNFSWAHGTLGTALAWSGRHDEAIAQTEIALRYNPRDATVYFRYLVMALAHFGAGRDDQAADFAARVVHWKPDWYLAHALLIASLELLGRGADVQYALQESRVYVPRISVARIEALPFRSAAERARLRAALTRAGALVDAC